MNVEKYYRAALLVDGDSFVRFFQEIEFRNGVLLQPNPRALFEIVSEIMKEGIGELEFLKPIYLFTKDENTHTDSFTSELKEAGFRIHGFQQEEKKWLWIENYLKNFNLNYVRKLVLFSDAFVNHAPTLEWMTWRGVRVHIYASVLTIDTNDMISDFGHEVCSEKHPLISFKDILVFSHAFGLP
ncbi:MAG: hypothetical protein HY472_00150 [Candidatus Sungbacteria bacterium]|nr:hypothetical protein [Candidatus Sungbacteria bacterium]